MNKIQKISSYLLLIFNFLIFLIPTFLVLQWIYIEFKSTNSFLNFFGILEKSIQTPEGYINLSAVTWNSILKLLGLCADIIGILPFLISLFLLKIIFSNYKKGEIFIRNNAILYRKLGFLYLIDALLIKSFSNTLMILAVTFMNSPGHRYLTVSFQTPNLYSLFFGTIIIIVSWVMLDASKLHDDNKFII